MVDPNTLYQMMGCWLYQLGVLDTTACSGKQASAQLDAYKRAQTCTQILSPHTCPSTKLHLYCCIAPSRKRILSLPTSFIACSIFHAPSCTPRTTHLSCHKQNALPPQITHHVHNSRARLCPRPHSHSHTLSLQKHAQRQRAHVLVSGPPCKLAAERTPAPCCAAGCVTYVLRPLPE